MSEDDGQPAAPHPRETFILEGHADSERALLEAYRGGRIPHAWLIGGSPGIGKATLAYRMARFVLAHPDPAAKDVQDAASLAVDAGHPIARRVAAQAHTDLLVLERTIGDTGKLRRNIQVDDVRRSVSFFGSTAGEGGWRVAIVDAVDELKAEGENALLKVLEEPPPRCLLLLVGHAPGSVRATIRSRCRRLMLRPLTVEQVARAAAGALDLKRDDADLAAAAAMSDGSVARAIALLDADALKLRRQVADLLSQLPTVDARALHALGDALGGADQRTFERVLDSINGWLSTRLAARLADNAPADKSRMARIAQAFEEINRSAREAQEYNLERKPLIFNVFGRLADAARG